MIYIICFVIATLFAYLANKSSKKVYRYIFSAIAILAPSILAGLRSTNIGTDINIYVLPAFNVAKNSENFITYLTNIQELDTEFLYNVLVYVIAKTTNSINVLLFVQHFIICLLFYIGAYNFRNKSYSFVTYSLFLLMYYNMSLNLIRQFIAMAIIFFALKYIYEKKPIKYIISIGIAMLFHSTAIIALLFYFVYIICKLKRRNIYLCTSVIILLIAVLNYNQILNILVDLGLIASKYATRYSIKDVNDFNFDIANTTIRIYNIVLIIYEYNKLKNDEDNQFFTMIAVYDLIILQIGAFVPFAYRISIYFDIVNIANVSRILKSADIDKQICIKNKNIMVKNNKYLFILLTYLMYLAYFIFTYIMAGSNETYPYQFFFKR